MVRSFTFRNRLVKANVSWYSTSVFLVEVKIFPFGLASKEMNHGVLFCYLVLLDVQVSLGYLAFLSLLFKYSVMLATGLYLYIADGVHIKRQRGVCAGGDGYCALGISDVLYMRALLGGSGENVS